VSPSPAGTGQERGHVTPTPATGGPTDANRVDQTPANAASRDIDTMSAASTNMAPTIGMPTNGAPTNGIPHGGGGPQPNGGARPNGAPGPIGAERSAINAPAGQAGGLGPGDPPANADRNGQCTAPQLRRFIKSRPYVPMHELRRRFGIDGGDDDVTPVRLDPGWVYVGLPTREGSLLGDLLRAGEIGYELSLDPRTPIVIGVYPMRPIPRS
jgi:hypothetical protein